MTDIVSQNTDLLPENTDCDTETLNEPGAEMLNEQITKTAREEAPTAILFAGVNGAGKTSLYHVMNTTEPLGVRISIDDIVRDRGSWQDYILQIKAAKLAIEQIQKCISDRVSYHHETTLPGKIVYKQLERSRAMGYRIILYYVGIDGIQTAIERVHRRVEQGGHGIDDRAIIQRYQKMPANLRRILPLCDEAYFYDNTVRFRQIAIHKGGEILDEDPILPDWYQSIFTGHTVADPFIQ
ncbi:MAG: zeta toxin family protein [Clostridia bacterium]|nr:zeta toxin family protein [Clostridia bacterium]